MTERDERLCLDDIVRAIDRILSYTAEGRDAFFGGLRTQDAIHRAREGWTVKVRRGGRDFVDYFGDAVFGGRARAAPGAEGAAQQDGRGGCEPGTARARRRPRRVR